MKPDNILTISYLAKHPDRAARVLESLPLQMTADLLENLTPEEYLYAYDYLIPSYGAGLLGILAETARNNLTAELASEKLAVLLLFLDDPTADTILSGLPSKKRKKIASLMQYSRNTVGSIMKPPSLALPQEISAAEAVKRIRTCRTLNVAEIFILDKTLHYIGMISLDKIIQAPSHKKLAMLPVSKVAALQARKPLQNLTENSDWTYHRVLPVTDGRGILIGALDYADLVQHQAIEMPQVKNKMAKHSSALELIFQALAIPIETLVLRLFPADKTNITRKR